MNWTDEQSSAINFREPKSVLLSAAAGSGKTAVLVQRIISRLTDSKDPLNINELLVLTFTEAAALEMKQKIRKAVKDALSLSPESEHLKRQVMLLHSAQISTIHAFLHSVLKGNAHLSDLPFGFSLASEEEKELLLKEALDTVFEKYYKNMNKIKPFYELSFCYGGAKGDSALRGDVLKLYDFLKSLPYPKEWLNQSVRNYEILYKETNIKNTLWQKAYENIEANLKGAVDECLNSLKTSAELLPEDHRYNSYYNAEVTLVKDFLEKLKNTSSGEKSALIAEFSTPPKARKVGTNPYEEALCDAAHQTLKDNFNNLTAFIKLGEVNREEFYKKLYYRAKTLKNVMLMLDRVYAKLKAEKSLADFSDLEHGALKLLTDKDHNPTALSFELKKRYKEILIDEYQDTSNIQDEIFSLISRNKKNTFMAGDIKQSIYKFRNAQSALFLGKREKYIAKSDEGALLTLSKNFRSRKEIISLCNFVFSNIMSAHLGDVDYDENEALKFGASYSEEKEAPEFYLITNDEAEDGSIDALREKEARFILSRIKVLLKELEVTEKDGSKRPLEYKDIVILMRNRSALPIFKEVFEEEGVPLDTDAPKGFLSSLEIELTLSLLALCDNPRQDIPLIAALRSKIFSFTPDELAEIRLLKKDGDFYEALCLSRDKNEKASYFLSELDILRKAAEEKSIFGLLVFIYERYNLISLFSYLSSPGPRKSNLKTLLQKAKSFEKSGKSGLFAFMSYVEKLKENDKDLAAPKSTSGENAVKIMTFHRSKGLEFPVVFIADTSHKFNLSDTSKNITVHDNLGLCLAMTDEESKIRYPYMTGEIFKATLTDEYLSEEMRLLYVALTRAKEKLIITSAIKTTKTKAQGFIFSKDKKPLLCQLKAARSHGQWLVFALLTHKDAKPLREYYGFDEDITSNNSDFPLICDVLYTLPEAGEDSLKQIPKEQTKSDNILPLNIKEDIHKVLSFDKVIGSQVPFKLSVSALKKKEKAKESSSLKMGRSIAKKEKQEFSPAERGTITHFMLSFLDEKKILCESDLNEALDKAEKDGIISTAQKNAVRKDTLIKLYESDLFIRLRKSKKTFKEYSFYIYIKAGEILKDIPEEEKDLKVMLQGTIDCFFEDEDGEFVLIDYKTDRITADEAKERAKEYALQLDGYSKALYEIFGKAPKERYIYFLSINHAERL